jgi:hypothetical protein
LKHALCLAVCAALLCLAHVARAADAPVEDAYLRGYVSAVLERDFTLSDAISDVRDGVVYLREESVGEADRARVRDAVASVKGVVDVRYVPTAEAAVPPPAPGASSLDFLPAAPLFRPVIGDPRWPRFSATYQWYRKDPILGHVGSATFGGMFPILQGPAFADARWDMGIQAGVFSIFDLDADSLDLVNADYWIGFPIGARWGPVALTVRPYHQSSHLGDEFLLRTRTNRINLSFEAIDALLGVDLWSFGRIYGGGGYMVHTDPSDLKRGYAQGGLELISPWALFGGTFRPLAVVDVEWRGEQQWHPDYSTRAGFRIEKPSLLGSHRLYLLYEYYNGRSPNGQFFERRIREMGLGLHLEF